MNYKIYFSDIIYFNNYLGTLTSFLYFSSPKFLKAYNCLQQNW